MSQVLEKPCDWVRDWSGSQNPRKCEWLWRYTLLRRYHKSSRKLRQWTNSPIPFPTPFPAHILGHYLRKRSLYYLCSHFSDLYFGGVPQGSALPYERRPIATHGLDIWSISCHQQDCLDAVLSAESDEYQNWRKVKGKHLKAKNNARLHQLVRECQVLVTGHFV